MEKIIIAVNDRGYRIGQDHHNARLLDCEIELIRILHERDGMSYWVLAEKFEASKSTIAAICQYKRRAQTTDRWKRVTPRSGPATAPRRRAVSGRNYL